MNNRAPSSVIHWFSGTGNTLWAARAVARELGDCALRPIANAPAAAETSAAPRVGIAFPVYCFGAPAIVEQFLDRVQVAPGSYLFLLMTCGGAPGTTAKQVEARLARRGIQLAAAFSLTLPDNYPPLGGAPGLKKQQRLLGSALPRVQQIAAAIRAETQNHFEQGSVSWRVLGRWLHPWFIHRVAGMDKKFRADAKCNGCGRCAKLCPVANITLTAGRPCWQGHCEQCFACFHWCPQSAIQFGWGTAKQRRYHHPDCQLADLLPAPPL